MLALKPVLLEKEVTPNIGDRKAVSVPRLVY